MNYVEIIQGHLPDGCYIVAVSEHTLGRISIDVQGCGNLMDFEPFMEQTDRGWMVITPRSLGNYRWEQVPSDVYSAGRHYAIPMPARIRDSATIYLLLELTYEEAAARLMQALMEK